MTYRAMLLAGSLVLLLFSCGNGDNKPPTVLSFEPANGSSINISRPLLVKFSEPISETSLRNIKAKYDGHESSFGYDLTAFNQDPTTLKIGMFTPTSYPATLRIDLSGLTDLAGNKLAPPNEWTLTVPEWLQLNFDSKSSSEADYHRSARMAAGYGGAVYVAYYSTIPEPTDRNTNAYTTFVYRLTEDGVEKLGSYLFDPGCDPADASCTDQSGTGASDPSIAIDTSGRPVVASAIYNYDSSGNVTSNGIGVSHWEGDRWTRLPDPANFPSGANKHAGHPHLTAGDQGELALTYEVNDSGIVHAYFAYSQTGSSWVGGATPLNHDTGSHAYPIEPAFSPDGSKIAITWLEVSNPTNIMLRYCDTQANCGGADTVTGSSDYIDLFRTRYRDDGSLLILYALDNGSGRYDLIVDHYKGLSLGKTTVTSTTSWIRSADLYANAYLIGEDKMLVAWSEDGDPDVLHFAVYDGSNWNEYTPPYTSTEDVYLYNVQVDINEIGQAIVHWGGESAGIGTTRYYDFTTLLNPSP